MWIHINFTFKRKNAQHRENYYLSKDKFILFKRLIRKIIIDIDTLYIKVKRKFFLFEPSPHCFLAIEIDKLPFKDFSMNFIKKPKWIKEISWRYARDETNGELFLNTLNSITDVILSYSNRYPTWLENFPKNQRLIAHIIHCSMNSLTNSRVEELKFYRRMIKKYRKGLSKDAKNKYCNLFSKSF